ncbi:Transient receptor potential cation channel subfamily A member 1 [Stylophora pistillata]|uniref:Transient receptor potential cation channel subfamily A member 1 n=1 Tax=Stylophora pistillata TaxID=50429 RepID=A0A2B4SDD9_STYPI|nr:Transient receptor potential cation channel subfamily A member 1 [Stylophora pistillata]
MRKSREEGKVADENESQREQKGRRKRFCNPFKSSKDEAHPDGNYDLPLVDYHLVADPDRTFVYDDGAMEVSDTGVTSVSPRALKIFEAIREDEAALVLEELGNLQDAYEIDKKDRHGFALIHVAARYNLNRIVHTLLDYGADINIGTSQYKWTPLHLAARFNGLSTINVLLQRGADPSIKGNKGSTPLHFAARRGNEEIVKALLEHPSVKIDEKDSSGKTALHLACSEGHSKVSQILMNYGADIKAISADKSTPLHNAIVHGHSQIARLVFRRASDSDLCTNTKEMVENEDLQNNTVLHLAAWNNDVKTAELCLENGANANSKKSDETSALHLAATRGNLEVAELLLSRGASVDVKDGDSKTPLHRAAMFNQTKFIELLMDKDAKLNARDGEGRSPFLNAVAAGHVEAARALLQHGADISATDLLMKTCVHLAVENEKLKMLAMLLETREGTNNLSKADLWDRVPLHSAALTKDIKILEVLLSKQKQMSYRDVNYRTPLHLAAESSSSKHVDMLARRMCGVNDRDDLGRTPLHCAARKGQRKACLVLLSMGAEINSRDNISQTPLMLSVKGNHAKCVELLLDYKASADLQDNDGDSALHMACGQGRGAIVELLLNRGASVVLLNDRNHACLETAAKAGSSDASMIFVKHKRWSELENYKTSTGQNAMSLLVENFPEAAEVLLNQCVHHSQRLNASDPDYAVTYNFKYLDPGPNHKDRSTRSRFAALEAMIKHKRQRLLLHPLTLKLNQRKWSTLGRYVFISDFLTYLLLMILITAFIVIQREGQHFRPSDNKKARPRRSVNTMGNDEDDYKPKPSDIYPTKTPFTQAAPVIIMMRYRLFGTYISMYIEVTKTVFQVLLVFVFLLLAFALVFHILFKEQAGFHTLQHSILRVMVMMIGELDFGAIFIDSIGEYKSEKKTRPLNPFPQVGFFFIFLCLFLLAVALMNLLVGLAVGDIDQMKKFATVRRLAMQIEYQIEIEEAYPSFIINRVYQEVYVEKPNKYSRRNRVIDWLYAWFDEATPEPVADEDSKTNELAVLQEEMTKNKKRIKTMMEMLEAQNNLLRSLAHRIDPSFELLGGNEETRGRGRMHGVDGPDGKHRAPHEGGTESEVPTDDTSVEFTREEKAATSLFEGGL